MKVAYLFPGQGAQYVGMGRELYDVSPAARDVFDLADRVLDVPISQLCFEGPEEELVQTKNCQIAIYVTSIAAWQALEALDLGFQPVAATGLSLGEIPALVVCGAMSVEEGLLLVQTRAKLMDEAAKRSPGTMASIVGLDRDAVTALAAETGCVVANLNSAVQSVISGTAETVAAGMEAATAAGAKRAVQLQVSGAFHSPLMASATPGFREALKQANVQPTQLSCISNVTARPEDTPEEIRSNLAVQMETQVLWEDSMRYLLDQGIQTYIELGPGKVLKGLMRRIDKAATVYNVEGADDLTALREAMATAHSE